MDEAASMGGCLAIGDGHQGENRARQASAIAHIFADYTEIVDQ